MRIWNLQDKIEEAVLKGHTEGVTSVAIAVNGKYIVSGSKGRTVRIWEFQNKRQLAITTVSSNEFKTVAIISDNIYYFWLE